MKRKTKLLQKFTIKFTILKLILICPIAFDMIGRIKILAKERRLWIEKS